MPKTIKQAAADRGIPETLIRAVVRQIGGIDSLQDVARHGANSGFPGFTYYRDTVAFFKRHKESIRNLVTQLADDLGEKPVDLVTGFNCLKPADMETYESAARCLYCNRLTDADTQVANALAWFALEEVAHAFEE